MKATAIGSMPGDDQPAYDEAIRIVLGELADFPALPEVPGRGAAANMIGRGLAVMADLGADLQPAGWRLTDASGIDHRRAKSLLAQDLDAWEEQTQGYVGPMKVQVAGPWTLAAIVEKPRGDKVVSDHGARRELAQALAEGVRGHVADLARRVPGAEWIVQIDEPMLPAVISGGVPTASGFGRHRSVDLPEASAALAGVLAAITESGATPWVHSCAPETPWDLIRGAGALGLAADVSQLTARTHDVLAEALEAGESVALGLISSTGTDDSVTAIVERILRWLDLVGLDPAVVGDQLVITPTCGLAGASPTWARRALTLSREAATAFSAG